MAPKKQPTLLTIPDTSTAPAPPERHSWAFHSMVKDDCFWGDAAKGFAEAGDPFEDKSSNSFAEFEGFRTLFSDSNDGKWFVSPLALCYV